MEAAHNGERIGELVAEARRLTGKLPTDNDALLIAYLDAQEIHTVEDFFRLSGESFEQITRQPCVTLLMADTLRRLCRRESPPSSRSEFPNSKATEVVSRDLGSRERSRVGRDRDSCLKTFSPPSRPPTPRHI